MEWLIVLKIFYFRLMDRFQGAWEGFRLGRAEIVEMELDPITGLPNLRSFFRYFFQVSKVRKNQPFAVVCFDLDGLKQINDSKGHAAGNIMLQTFAITLEKFRFRRKTDLCFRTGGDEFMVYARRFEDLESLRLRVEAARSLFRAICKANEDLTADVDFSYGIVIAPRHECGLLLDVMAEADKAMYCMKNRHHEESELRLVRA